MPIDNIVYAGKQQYACHGETDEKHLEFIEKNLPPGNIAGKGRNICRRYRKKAGRE